MPTFATRCGGVLALWCLCAGLTAARAESVTLERDNVLRSEPRIEAATVANLPNGSTGEALARQGAWVQIRSGNPAEKSGNKRESFAV